MKYSSVCVGAFSFSKESFHSADITIFFQLYAGKNNLKGSAGGAQEVRIRWVTQLAVITPPQSDPVWTLSSPFVLGTLQALSTILSWFLWNWDLVLLLLSVS